MSCAARDCSSPAVPASSAGGCSSPFLRANDDLRLGAEATVLTRDPLAFAAAAPHVAEHPAVKLLGGDVRSFEFPSIACTHVLHMATETALEGPEHHHSIPPRGAPRGSSNCRCQRRAVTPPHELWRGLRTATRRLRAARRGVPRRAARPKTPSAGYAHGKRVAEFLCSVAAAETNLRVKIARCFAFVGPLLPLDLNFAIGNFIRDAELKDRIEVAGDGTPRRSYLYAADLAIWLWTILVQRRVGPAVQRRVGSRPEHRRAREARRAGPEPRHSGAHPGHAGDRRPAEALRTLDCACGRRAWASTLASISPTRSGGPPTGTFQDESPTRRGQTWTVQPMEPAAATRRSRGDKSRGGLSEGSSSRRPSGR